MDLDRTTIIRGPAQIEYPAGSAKYYYSQGDIRLTLGHEVFPITNSSFGHVQDRSRQRTATVSFTPVGQFLTGLWPWGSKLSGDSILINSDGTTADQNLVVWSYKGTKVTIYNVALTKMPDLILSTTKTLAGEATFTGLGKGYPFVSQDTADSFYTWSENNGKPNDNFNPYTVITQPYTASWCTSSHFTATNDTGVWGALNTVNGWHVTFDMALQPVEVDQYGIVDWTVGDVKATARGQLIGITEAQAIEAVRLKVLRGAPMDTTNDLVISNAGGSSIIVSLYSAIARVVPAQYGLTTMRLADMEFSATRQIPTGGGSPLPMFNVTGAFSPF